MSELEFRRLIPLAAAASLVTVGCGSGTDKLAKKICELAQECDEEAFDAAFDSIGECTDTYEEYLDENFDEIREDYGGACANALIDFASCTVDNTTCNAEEYDYYEIIEKCDDEVDAVTDKCE